jgi:hypothetical protein
MTADPEDLKVVLLAMSAILHRMGWAIVTLAVSDGERVVVQKFNGIEDADLMKIFEDGGETIQ